jgi:hypothetical protein
VWYGARRHVSRELGIAVGLASILGGLVATAMSLKALFLGSFVAIAGLWPVIFLVLGAIFVLFVPGIFGIVAVVLSARRKQGSTPGLVFGGVGLLTAFVAGPTLYGTGEMLKPSSAPKAPRPKACAVVTQDTSAINRPCNVRAGSLQGDCPNAEYMCTKTLAGLTGDRGKPQDVCEIPCTHDCQCPAGTTCRNGTCQRGNDLPP